MTGILDFGRKVLESQSFSRLLGTELVRFEQGIVELRLPLKPEHLQQHGFAHGGIVAYMADNALTYAGGGTVLGNVLTLEMKLNYIRPAVGEALVARASVISSGRTQAVCRCEVFAVTEGEEKLCAAAQGTIVPMPKQSGKG